MKYKLFFWQNMISPHQSDLLLHLSRHPDVDTLTLVVEQSQDKERELMGWAVPDLKNIEIIISPSINIIHNLIAKNREGDIHIFSGIAAYPTLKYALRKLKKEGALVGVMSEPSNWLGIKGMLRM